MRTRIRLRIYRLLQEVAEEESERTGEHVTVSDLVRSACYNYLLVYDALRKLENMPPPEIEDAVLIVQRPMLTLPEQV